ncbi:iron complex transport system substrate-binding protein [Candidatus Planktophila versatilis]|uniref:Iron complex transport system substrate-binding protein n=1 Tax=Candidatus Planktophila versatilis TaxID=1884905 RepID=A0AAD0E6J2_9ACTN|nr:ABC transporter substrate-binding protein [Candidatus Planktophila versatilis]ASY22422.1 iron complex transport system substrate-binding protein [Candidatus Planktophila versatilis]ASY26222.1 iron complex transport system substrate-binding protein [Candidatus Planktophila versatilis]
MRKERSVITLGVLTITSAALLLTGCSKVQSTAIEISSAQVTTIESSESPLAQKVVALANGAGEIISAMGFKSILIGRDIASTDADLRKVPVVTSGHQVIAEKIIALTPDLVIIDKSTGPQSALDALAVAGIRVVKTPEAWTLSDLPAKVGAIADAIGAPASGSALSAAMNSSLSTLGTAERKSRVVFLYLRGGSSIYLIGGKGSGADSLITAIGAQDVGAATLANPFNAMTSELIASLNPDVILVMSKGLQSVGGLKGLVELPGIAQTDAGKNKRVIAVDDSLLLSFGPRTPDLLSKLSAAMAKAMK